MLTKSVLLLSRGYVIHVDGLFTENGFGQGGVPLAVESEEALYRKLGL
ncbi:uncharacterized protein JCM6883_006282, partial [Sporobolomyces salmoneus]